MPASLKKHFHLPMAGLVPWTTQDFPGRQSCVIFLQGCRWRCRYCHNTHLWSLQEKGTLDWKDVESFLKRRRGLLDAVVFSGGEPLLHPDLLLAVDRVKELGFQVALHTAGAVPSTLGKLLPKLDWVGFDMKAPFQKYEKVTLIRGSGGVARQSAQLLMESGVPYEFRTSLHSSLLNDADLIEITKDLKELKAQRFYLQEVRTQGCQDVELLASQARIQESVSSQTLEFLHQSFAHFGIRCA